MVRDQQRASDSDLSQSAYDSAMAGVEDAKRALTKYSEGSMTGDLTRCNAINNVLSGVSVDSPPPGEVLIRATQQGGIANSDDLLNQAYTCVRVNLNPADYLGEIEADEMRLVPLKATGEFDTVRLEWFSKDDISGGMAVDVPAASANPQLTKDWPATRPSVLEAQLMQTGASFTLDSFDDRSADNKSNANTLFLYPSVAGFSTGIANAANFSSDLRRVANVNNPDGVRCEKALSGGTVYSCAVDIKLPDPIGGSASTRTNTFLRLAARYNKTSFRVSLYNGTNAVTFDGVQPEVDSTGRANDLFRRVSARVEVNPNVPYPEAAVDITGNFCKTFSVTDKQEDFDRGVCTP
jgi:hypothetical protein